jgi:hypothetical protein
VEVGYGWPAGRYQHIFCQLSVLKRVERLDKTLDLNIRVFREWHNDLHENSVAPVAGKNDSGILAIQAPLTFQELRGMPQDAPTGALEINPLLASKAPYQTLSILFECIFDSGYRSRRNPFA